MNHSRIRPRGESSTHEQSAGRAEGTAPPERRAGGGSPPGARARHAQGRRLQGRGLSKPLIGIANTWIEIGPCNYHLRELAQHVREGIQAAGGTAMEFNTVSISDGITMGTSGMRMSLVSREVIADSIEMVVDGNQLDGVIALVGCDKTIPGAAMALARINVPGLVLYGGSIAPGRQRRARTSPFRTSSRPSARTPPAASRPRSSSRSRTSPVRAPAPAAASSRPTRCPACASSSASRRWAATTSRPLTPPKARSRARLAQLVVDLVRRGVTPRQILTPAAFQNAIASVVATGGSTNAVLHLLAIAREAGVELDLELFNRDERGGALARGPQAGRPVRRDRPAQGRRHEARRPAPPRDGRR